MTSGSDGPSAGDPGPGDPVTRPPAPGAMTADPKPSNDLPAPGGSSVPGPARDGSTLDRPKKDRPKKELPMWQESILLVGTAVILALLIKTFLVQAFYIPPSGSMRDTLEDNDRILVQKVSYWFHDPQRGDIVVFDDPANWLGEEDGEVPTNVLTKSLSFLGLYPSGGHLVKRVIGVGGDHVACRRGSVVVPAQHLWVLGDNREHSADSRAHMGDPGGGFVPVDDVVGKAFVVLWPVHRWQFIHRPATFDNPRLDQAASIISVSAPTGLTALAVPALYRRRKNRIAHR